MALCTSFPALILLAWSLTGSVAWGDAAPTWGPEFTFTSMAILTKPAPDAPYDDAKMGEQMRAWAVELRAICRGRTGPGACRVIDNVSGHFDFSSVEYTNIKVGNPPKPLRFDLTIDPGVIEVPVTPMTVAEWKANEQWLQNDIFGAAAKAGLKPNPYKGGGHMNLGQSAFGKNLDSFVDFVVDVANHPELGQGILGMEDLANAPSIAQLDVKQRAAFARLVADARDGKVRSIEDFAASLRSHVYYAHPRPHPQMRVAKAQGLNVESLVSPMVKEAEKRVELRFPSAQEDVGEFIRNAELFEGRLGYLRRIRAEGKPVEFLDVKVPSGQRDVLGRFRAFVEEAGRNWTDHQKFKQTKFREFASRVKPVPLSTVTPGESCLRTARAHIPRQ